MSEDTGKDEALLLKAQAKIKDYQKQNPCLRAKLKDTQKSRSYWKSKAKEYSKNRKTCSDTNAFVFEGMKAKHHSYSLVLVAFCANIQAYGAMSLRSCVHVLFCLQLAFGSQKRSPSYSSIRVWVCKLGKYRIENQEISEEKWLYWIDESIHIGSEKILLVLGIPQKNLDFQTGLCLSQLRVLHM